MSGRYHCVWPSDTAARRELIANRVMRPRHCFPARPTLITLRVAFEVLGIGTQHPKVAAVVARAADQLYLEAYPRPTIDGAAMTAERDSYHSSNGRSYAGHFASRELLLPREPGNAKRAHRLYDLTCVGIVCKELGIKAAVQP